MTVGGATKVRSSDTTLWRLQGFKLKLSVKKTLARILASAPPAVLSAIRQRRSQGTQSPNSSQSSTPQLGSPTPSGTASPGSSTESTPRPASPVEKGPGSPVGTDADSSIQSGTASPGSSCPPSPSVTQTPSDTLRDSILELKKSFSEVQESIRSLIQGNITKNKLDQLRIKLKDKAFKDKAKSVLKSYCKHLLQESQLGGAGSGSLTTEEKECLDASLKNFYLSNCFDNPVPTTFDDKVEVMVDVAIDLLQPRQDFADQLINQLNFRLLQPVNNPSADSTGVTGKNVEDSKNKSKELLSLSKNNLSSKKFRAQMGFVKVVDKKTKIQAGLESLWRSVKEKNSASVETCSALSPFIPLLAPIGSGIGMLVGAGEGTGERLLQLKTLESAFHCTMAGLGTYFEMAKSNPQAYMNHFLETMGNWRPSDSASITAEQTVKAASNTVMSSLLGALAFVEASKLVFQARAYQTQQDTKDLAYRYQAIKANITSFTDQLTPKQKGLINKINKFIPKAKEVNGSEKTKESDDNVALPDFEQVMVNKKIKMGEKLELLKIYEQIVNKNPSDASKISEVPSTEDKSGTPVSDLLANRTIKLSQSAQAVFKTHKNYAKKMKYLKAVDATSSFAIAGMAIGSVVSAATLTPGLVAAGVMKIALLPVKHFFFNQTLFQPVAKEDLPMDLQDKHQEFFDENNLLKADFVKKSGPGRFLGRVGRYLGLGYKRLDEAKIKGEFTADEITKADALIQFLKQKQCSLSEGRAELIKDMLVEYGGGISTEDNANKIAGYAPGLKDDLESAKNVLADEKENWLDKYFVFNKKDLEDYFVLNSDDEAGKADADLKEKEMKEKEMKEQEFSKGALKCYFGLNSDDEASKADTDMKEKKMKELLQLIMVNKKNTILHFKTLPLQVRLGFAKIGRQSTVELERELLTKKTEYLDQFIHWDENKGANTQSNQFAYFLKGENVGKAKNQDRIHLMMSLIKLTEVLEKHI